MKNYVLATQCYFDIDTKQSGDGEREYRYKFKTVNILNFVKVTNKCYIKVSFHSCKLFLKLDSIKVLK